MRTQPYGTAVREMPREERPRERLQRLGPEALRDAELLAILFRTGSASEDVIAMADRIIHSFGNLRALARASLEELQQVKGIGPAKAIEIRAALELGRRLARFNDTGRRRVTGAQDVVDELMIDFKEYEVEHFKCVLMNTKNEIMKIVDVSTGGLDATLAMPRDVFRQAIRDGASAVIVCHNHPSGDPEPSRDDVALTKRLDEAATLLGIRFLDHIVFGDGRYTSMKERGLF